MIAEDSTEVTYLSAPIPANTLWLNDLLIDASLKWQVHNCKITDETVTQDATLPFLYHYDTLSADLKAAHPLTPALLKRFNEPMSAAAAAQLLQLPSDTIPAPWQVKIIGTLVLFSESLQIAVRLRFTNSAKALEPVYVSDKAQAVTQAMQTWHFFSDVFVLNKCAKPIGVLPAEAYASTLNTESQARSQDVNEITVAGNVTEMASDLGTDTDSEATLLQETALLLPRDSQYQHLQPQYAVALLSELEAHKAELPELDKAIQARIA
ncbi:hypothetical protein PSAR109036_09295 [Psychrobacter arenosus]|uniref:hypothetical protein n=1 Tax=Psychrobacter arenosus TaxID=256326 RepID=UPI00191966C6|nr:hypothetical protein [Psychrobacter arenosus]